MNNKEFLKKIVVGIGFIIVSTLLIKRGVSIIGWIGLLFFGSATILAILIYFFPKSVLINKLYLNITGKLNENAEGKKNFMEIYNDDGIFEYNDSGFIIQTPKSKENINWDQIYLMLGYKEDLFSIDSICLNVYYGENKSFNINEETLGWFNFLKYSKTVFPNIEKDWEFNISVPVFERKLTVIYDSKNRELSEILKEIENN